MLVITRKTNEKILLPDLGIEIIVARVLPNGSVRVGIKAPSGVKILREELMEGESNERGRSAGSDARVGGTADIRGAVV